MSQRAFLQELDADLHAAFADVGVADAGTYAAPGEGATPVACRVYVNRDTVSYGSVGEIVGAHTELGILRADVEQPAQRGLVAVDGDVFKLAQQVGQDESMTRWVVTAAGGP